MPGPLSHVDPPDAERLDPSAVHQTVRDLPRRVKPQTWNRAWPPGGGSARLVTVEHPPAGGDGVTVGRMSGRHGRLDGSGMVGTQHGSRPVHG